MSLKHIKILKRILTLCFPQYNLKPFFRPYFTWLFKAKKNWGIVYTIKYYKQMRLHCTRYICGHPLLTNDMSIGLTKDGWPKKLLFLKPFVDNNSLQALKLVMTVLNFSRSFTLSEKEWEKVEPNYASITDPPKGRYIIPGGIINKFVQKFHLAQTLPSFNKEDIYLFVKAGPDGPSTLTANNSILCYSYDEMQNIFNITSQEGIDYFCKQYKISWDNNRPVKCLFNGRLSFVKDPEAKLRIIAISDYYTQLFLKPIHDKIMNLLKHFNSDRTYTQDPSNEWEDNGHSFWSLDLSSATDRFPIYLQKRLLVRVFNEEFANSWSWLLSNRKFELPEDGPVKYVKYSTGQPMGTYSSW